MCTSRFIAALVVLMVCLTSRATRAQDAPFVMPEPEQEDVPFVEPSSACTEGRVQVDGGYCCWPAQHASADGRCLGPPRCPAGLAAAGADCVAPTAPAAGPVAGRDGSFASLRAESPPRNQVDGGLLGGGITLIILGWLGNGVTDTLGGGQVNYSGSRTGYRAALPLWPFGWVPILHPFAAINSDGTWGGVAAVVGTIGALMEISGLIMAIAGAIGHAPVTLRSVGLRFGTAGADAGLSFDLAF